MRLNHDNKLKLKVTNASVNPLIGDQHPGVKNEITYTTIHFYQANSSLLPWIFVMVDWLF